MTTPPSDGDYFIRYMEANFSKDMYNENIIFLENKKTEGEPYA